MREATDGRPRPAAGRAHAVAHTRPGDNFFPPSGCYLGPSLPLRYQGEQAAQAEVELRWQLHPRFSLVEFGRAGVARSDIGERTASRR
jgi:hypothetical protein